MAFAVLTGQPYCQTAAQYIARGDKEMHDGYPRQASEYYHLALHKDSSIAEAHFKLAESLRMLRDYDGAAKHYRKAIQYDAKRQFTDAIFWEAMMYKHQMKYELAMKTFQLYLGETRQRDRLYRWARDEVEACRWVIANRTDSGVFDIEIPEPGINTPQSELAPMPLGRHRLLLASVQYNDAELKKSKNEFISIKMVRFKDSIWVDEPLPFQFNFVDAHVANGSFSPDSSVFYFSVCPNTEPCSIYRMKKMGNSWGEAEMLPSPVNVENSSNTQPFHTTIGEDEYLIFSSNRSGGKGGYDLWFAPLKNNEPTGRIRNFGNRVNTDGDEITPRFDPSDTTLYFSSNRHPGFGGFDVFVSKGMPGSLNLVKNAGAGLNSSFDDYYTVIFKKDSLGYLVSNRNINPGGDDITYCCNDVFKVKFRALPKRIVPEDKPDSMDTLIAVVIGNAETQTDTVKDLPGNEEYPENIEELQDLLPISLFFHNDDPDPGSRLRSTRADYSSSLHAYLAKKQEYMAAIDNSDMTDIEKARAKTEMLRFFEEELAGSIDKLNQALDVIIAELDQGNSITLAVKGYASSLADSDYNLNLTYRRIASMENYMRKYRDGVMLKYMEDGNNGPQLVIEKHPYGESKASTAEEPKTRFEAIYSLQAIHDRRIEILRVVHTEDIPLN
ncbi:MAG: hypothetical protein Kow0075_16990 [Salibacteraceae bacterium]